MRASMTAGGRERCKSIECIWGDPNGALGALALSGMAFKNGRQNKAALNLLAPRPAIASSNWAAAPAWACAMR